MLIDATDRFLDRMAITLAQVKGKESAAETHVRFLGLDKRQLGVINLRAALINKGRSKGP